MCTRRVMASDHTDYCTERPEDCLNGQKVYVQHDGFGSQYQLHIFFHLSIFICSAILSIPRLSAHVHSRRRFIGSQVQHLIGVR